MVEYFLNLRGNQEEFSAHSVRVHLLDQSHIEFQFFSDCCTVDVGEGPVLVTVGVAEAFGDHEEMDIYPNCDDYATLKHTI